MYIHRFSKTIYFDRKRMYVGSVKHNSLLCKKATYANGRQLRKLNKRQKKGPNQCGDIG